LKIKQLSLKVHLHLVSIVAGQDSNANASIRPKNDPPTSIDQAVIDWTANADLAGSTLRQLANSVASHPYGRHDISFDRGQEYPSGSAAFSMFQPPPFSSSLEGTAPETTARPQQMSVSLNDGLGSPTPFSYLMDLEDYYYNELLMFPQAQ
jgi:hypothetical protein